MENESNGGLGEEHQRLLELLGAGLSTTDAARDLGLSLRTAERRLAEARRRLGATTNAQAIACLWGPGLVAVDTRLTRREREVLELVAEGLRDEDIAQRLGIARSTVAALLRSAMAALGVRTRTQAAAKLAEKA
jgi:DNA-binding NarL/FixJ family response regulator